ncbi:MAG: multidrug effflux MFS transporter [Bauldia sp.]|nr:multidrug effflux MFS transporter [Bauldia sp.]
MAEQKTGFLKNAIILGLLVAVGPFAIDMYLPAMPAIAADLDTTTALTQLTLMVFFVSFGLFQLVYGPVSDQVGRKKPLYVGLALFTIGSIGSALAPSIELLIAARFVQGVGAAAGMVIARSIVRDLHTGVAATRLMSLVMLVFSVSPILAPLSGSALIEAFDWRAVFWAVTVAGLLGIGLVAFFLPETRPVEARVGGGLRKALSSAGQLLRDGRFMGITLIGGLGMAAFFAFLGASSFVYIDHFGLTPTQYSIAFSVNAIAFIGASQFSARLAARFGVGPVIAAAVTFFMVVTVALLALTLAGVDSLVVLMAMFFLAFGALGLVIPATMVLALEENGPIAGMAAALGGTIQFALGAIAIAVVSAVSDGTPLAMVAVIAAGAVGAFAISRVTLGRRSRQPVHVPAE